MIPTIIVDNEAEGLNNPSAPSGTITFTADVPKTKNAIHWKGCIKTEVQNCLNHVSKACDLPSFILSIEYVIVTKGAIVIKNATFTILFT